MRKNIAQLAILAAMAQNESNVLTAEKQQKNNLFRYSKGNEGLVKIVAQYHLILEGKSKLGKAKQARIIAKVDKFIKEGKLITQAKTEELTQEPKEIKETNKNLEQ